jgi:hypothetical protein
MHAAEKTHAMARAAMKRHEKAEEEVVWTAIFITQSPGE